MPDDTTQHAVGFGRPLRGDARTRAASVRLLALDVDGTLTDGRIIIGARGELAKSFSVHDGQGLRLLMDQGVQVAWITARQSDIVRKRAAELKVPHLIQSSRDKAHALRSVAAKLKLDLSECGFIGDDLPDIAPMRLAGFAACVADADPALFPEAHWCSERNGGRGAVRELCRFILHAQGRLGFALAPFLGEE